MAKQQNNNDWLKILVAAAEIGYFINRLNNNKVDAEYANNLMLRLGLYGLLGNNLYNGMSARQLSASRNSTALTDVEVQKRLTAKQKKYFITLADNKSKVEDLLTNEDNKVEADEFKNIVNDVFTKPKFEIAKEQKQKLDSISKQLEKRYSSKPLKFKLDEIYINDYRILKDFRIKFDSNISIIIGENGSGKSTLIEYISNAFARMFLDSMRKEINWTEYDLGKFEFKYSFYNDEENVKVAVKNESDVFLPIYTSESSTLWPDRFVVSYSGITDRLKKMVKENFEDTFVRIINNDGSKYSISPTEFNLPKNRFYYADDRYLNLIYCSLLFSKHEEAKALLDKIGVDFSRCEITFQFGETYHKYKNNFKGNIAPRFFDTLSVLSVGSILVGNQLQDMFREFRTDISSQEVFDILYYLKLNDLINDIKISWKNESGSFDLEHISEGQKQELMTLGLSLVFDSPNTLFLLDEPDTYLHPKWTRAEKDTILLSTCRKSTVRVGK